ncbi:hypothetical protein G7070_03720 [Propioniciclava coleopterorum]|uniref:Aldouronate transport system substrate-binding protein n=1 Tax=Propioniciclava coleopterorum TaxID=2714937 RepID=A0A6G7YAJ5_9ACTN|nr:hypothetical protein G7070_03720 [Propioniciclava coleopterorum]
MNHLSRRTILQAAGVGAAAVLGGPLLAACSNEGRGGVQPTTGAPGGGGGGGGVLPKYLPYAGVKPDIKGGNGVGDTFFAYPAEPVTAITAAIGDGKPIRTLGITNQPIPPALGNNAFWQELNKRIGSDLEISLANPADYNQRFPTAVAGDQLPDIFSVGSAPQLPGLLASKALDLTEYLAGDAIAKYPFLANIQTDSWKSCVYNGRLMAVPVPRGMISSYVLYGRDDLLASHGVSGPATSYQDLYDKAKAVTAPAENRWAFSYVPVDYIRQMYGVQNGWQEVGGTLQASYADPAQKDALEAAKKLFDDGLVVPDAFTAQWQDYKTWFGGGRAMYTFDSFSAWPSFLTLIAGEHFSLAAYPPAKAEGGGAAKAWLGNPTNSTTAINAKAKDRVETMLSFLNWCAAAFGTSEYLFRKYGIEGVNYTLEGTDPILNDKGKSETQLGLLYLCDAPWPIYQAGDRKATQAQYDAQEAFMKNAVQSKTVGVYSETNARDGSRINKAMSDLQNDIIQGRQPVSAWDQGVADWKKNGGDKIRDELAKGLQESGG